MYITYCHGTWRCYFFSIHLTYTALRHYIQLLFVLGALFWCDHIQVLDSNGIGNWAFHMLDTKCKGLEQGRNHHMTPVGVATAFFYPQSSGIRVGVKWIIQIFGPHFIKCSVCCKRLVLCFNWKRFVVSNSLCPTIATIPLFPHSTEANVSCTWFSSPSCSKAITYLNMTPLVSGSFTSKVLYC